MKYSANDYMELPTGDIIKRIEVAEAELVEVEIAACAYAPPRKGQHDFRSKSDQRTYDDLVVSAQVLRGYVIALKMAITAKRESE